VFAPTTGPRKVPWADVTLRVETFARVETTLVVVTEFATYMLENEATLRPAMTP
jgi:hypothetical protein